LNGPPSCLRYSIWQFKNSELAQDFSLCSGQDEFVYIILYYIILLCYITLYYVMLYYVIILYYNLLFHESLATDLWETTLVLAGFFTSYWETYTRKGRQLFILCLLLRIHSLWLLRCCQGRGQLTTKEEQAYVVRL
jgi:hypothetical protein